MRFVEIYAAEVEISIVTLCQFQLETNSRRSKPKLTWLVVSGGRQWVSFSTIQSWQVNCGLDTNPTRTDSWTSLTVLTQHYRISKQTLSLSSSFLLATKNSHLVPFMSFAMQMIATCRPNSKTSMCSSDQSPKHIWVIKVVGKNNFQEYAMVRYKRRLKSLSRFSLYFFASVFLPRN